MKSPDFDMLIDNKSSVHRYRKKLLISAGTVHVRVKKMEDAHKGARVLITDNFQFGMNP
jgi:hypothetical protein